MIGRLPTTTVLASGTIIRKIHDQCDMPALTEDNARKKVSRTLCQLHPPLQKRQEYHTVHCTSATTYCTLELDYWPNVSQDNESQKSRSLIQSGLRGIQSEEQVSSN